MQILIARDEAFNFLYRANVDALREQGEVTFFSPLHDTILPPCDLLYLPGGYPELFATQLEEGEEMRRQIRTYAEQGGHLFAECGGFMYLCHDIDGHAMCDIFPFHATMQDARLHLGYRKMTDSPLRGHEFHYSSIRPLDVDADMSSHHDRPSAVHPQNEGQLCEATTSSYESLYLQQTAKGKPVDTGLYRYRNVVAGYTHWYWGETGFPFTLLSPVTSLI